MTENLHDMTVGNVVGQGQVDKLTERYQQQRFNAEGMLAKLKEEREKQIDFIADTRTLNMVPIADEIREQMPQVEEQQRLHPTPPQVAIIPNNGDEWYKETGPVIPNSHAHEQIAAQLQIPVKYYRRMLAEQPDLLSANVNRWLEEKAARRMFRIQRDTNVGVARAYLSDRYRRLDNLELAESFVPMMADPDSGWQIHQCGLTSIRMHIEAVFPSLMDEVKVGDAVALAVKISSSEVGSGALSVQLGVHRLVCSNLMVVPKWSQRQVHLGRAQDDLVELLSDSTIRKEDQLIIDKMRDVVTGMADTDRFRELMGTLTESTQAALPNPIAATEILGKNLSLTEGELVTVKNEMIQGGDSSMWGLTNALTATARELDFERKAELELAAGTLLENASTWKQFTEADAA
jgi:hypothetical protein